MQERLGSGFKGFALTSDDWSHSPVIVEEPSTVLRSSDYHEVSWSDLTASKSGAGRCKP
ncbi:hypothetical protein SynBIOSE41_02420 [Synechococcus sp. BIOS-E4-1]|nr:hypothetical protein SynBIOSE41_02420 [Synechococcus sp. BIOS-E4-1]